MDRDELCLKHLWRMRAREVKMQRHLEQGESMVNKWWMQLTTAKGDLVASALGDRRQWLRSSA